MRIISKKKRKEYSAPALRTFFNIAKAWDLNNHQMCILLDLPSESMLQNWKQNPKYAFLKNNTIERLSYLFGIYKTLQILLTTSTIADQWIHYPNKNIVFNGQKPIDYMLRGQMTDLHLVRRYLDAELSTY